MEGYIVPVLCAFLGTLGFSIYYNVGFLISLINAVASMAGYFMYAALFSWTGSIFQSNFLVAVLMTMVCEICARHFRVPTTMMLVPMLFPEIPGSSLYNMIWNLLIGEKELCISYMTDLVVVIAALNLGIVLVTAIIKIYTNIRIRLRYGRYEGYR